ncbi:unnamed protein product [Sphenostylis stenocarpa]|uniref:Uncharacterized protein n=1 Tax=Sphenostylis stenocarpa TaxID=92480 RepID=A0AA86RY84_9FABA|nr:unnamed protein product [Sphenostylis stenocarpa]
MAVRFIAGSRCWQGVLVAKGGEMQGVLVVGRMAGRVVQQLRKQRKHVSKRYQ